MSEANVEMVRRALSAFADRGAEGVIPFITTDHVIYSIPEWPDEAEYHGHEGFRKLAGQWEENFDDFGFEVDDVRDAGDAVVALLEMTGRIRGIDALMTAPIGAVHEFRDGLVASIRYFSTWQGALEAVGLRE